MKLSRIGSLMIAPMLLSSCGAGQGKVTLKKNYPSEEVAPTITVDGLKISESRDIQYSKNISFKVFVYLANNNLGGCDYRHLQDRTYLKLATGIRDTRLTEDFHIYSSQPLANKPVIYAEGNLCKVTFPYDYEEKTINMVYKDKHYQVGQFQPLDHSNVSLSTTPIFCESDVCSIDLEVAYKPSEIDSLDYTGKVSIKWFDGSEQTAFQY